MVRGVVNKKPQLSENTFKSELKKKIGWANQWLRHNTVQPNWPIQNWPKSQNLAQQKSLKIGLAKS